MAEQERKLSGLFQVLRNIQVDLSLPKATESLPSFKIPANDNFWRRSLSRREVAAWLIGPGLPLSWIVYTAHQIDIRWDGKPTFPPTATPVPTRAATPTPTKTPLPVPGASEAFHPTVSVTSTSGGPAVSIEQRPRNRP